MVLSLKKVYNSYHTCGICRSFLDVTETDVFCVSPTLWQKIWNGIMLRPVLLDQFLFNCLACGALNNVRSYELFPGQMARIKARMLDKTSNNPERK